MHITEAQELFILIFVIYFTLIIDRANHKYNPYDTYNAWTGKPHTIRRLMLSWTILHIIPLLNFAIFFIILGINKISFDPNFLEVINIVLVDLLAFFIFGYYHVFEVEEIYDFQTTKIENFCSSFILVTRKVSK